MKHHLQLVFCIGLLVLTCGINVYGAIDIRGDGFINFDGTGEFLIQRFPIVIERFDSDCTPSTIPGITFLCRQPLDMSLLGNDIVRAAHVRVGASLRTLRSPLVLSFGSPTCGTHILVQEEDLVSVQGGVGTGWRLSDQAAQALQALIDQCGARSVFMSIGLQDGSVGVDSSVRAVAMDIKPGSVSNTLNPRNHGVVPVAILTTEIFDATSIDMTSLRFGATGEEAAALRAVLDDLDGDGDSDLLVVFRSRETAMDCETLFAYLSGVTMTGVSIAATDSVAMVGCH